jgi:hypothetical protein
MLAGRPVIGRLVMIRTRGDVASVSHAAIRRCSSLSRLAAALAAAARSALHDNRTNSRA